MKLYVRECFAPASLLTITHVAFASDPAMGSLPFKDDQKLWNFEHAYWRYVEENGLAAYSGVWRKEFLGWPSLSAAVHPDTPRK